MQHDVLLGRDIWMRFYDRSYCKLDPCPINNSIFSELTPSLPGLHVAAVFIPGSSAHPNGLHLLYAGDTGITSSHDHRLLDVDLACIHVP